MIQISSDVTTVMVNLTIQPEDGPSVEEVLRDSIPIFQDQPGFISLSLHRSEDGSRYVQYLQWRSQADHLACMHSPDWQADAGRRFMTLMQQGKLKMEPPAVFEVLTTLQAE